MNRILKIILLNSLAVLTLFPSTVISQKTNKSAIDFVNPFIGTANHGHVFLGANVPFGGVQLGPVNIDKGWDWCSGYNYASKEILGFTHTHLSGTGIGDWNDILLLPATGKVKVKPANKDELSDGYGSSFSHNQEICKPGFYSVFLKDYNVKVDLTTTKRVGMHRYTFVENNNSHIVLDLAFGTGWDSPVETHIEVVNDSIITGYRQSKGWAKNQQVYFAIKLSQRLQSFQLYDDSISIDGSKLTTVRARAIIKFALQKEEVVMVKVGISAVSSENALLNMQTEVPGWNFDKVKTNASDAWNKELSTVEYDASRDLKTIFYTALYHAYFFPSTYDDVNGQYRGSDQKVYSGDGKPNYTLFSLWDTYRALHPLLTITQSGRIDDIINSMLNIYKQQGKLPVWHLSGNETNTMVGYSAVPVVVDAYMKGHRGFDANLAYEAVKQSAMQKINGIQYIQKLAFIPADSVNESVAKALEYAIDDACIALMAKSMGKTEDAAYYDKRAKLYKLYFDSNTKFMRGKLANGQFRAPFSPFEAKHRENDYCEGNGWQYTWLVPQDVHGLIKLMGGDKYFTNKLDSLFNASGSMGEEASPDISGLIGQYAQGNEPNHHIPYLYNFAGEQWKTASMTRTLMDSMYTSQPDGLCGNEDAGQMSAWYVMSAMGFYQVHPGNGVYVIGSPRMEDLKLHLPNGKIFEIHVLRKDPKDKYIRGITFNNQPYLKSYITHSDIMKGGKMVIQMHKDPNMEFGKSEENRP